MAEPSSRQHVLRPAVALFCVALLAVAWRAQSAFQYERPRAPAGWVVLAAAAVLAVLVIPAFARRKAETPLGGRTESVAVIGLCLLGVFFRLVHFYVVPEGMNHDAGWYGQYANEIVRGTPYTPYIAAAWGRETLFMYVVAVFVTIFGNTPEALQAASALWGIAALLPFYLLARAMFGPRIGLVALGFFAVSGWHGVFSRAGWRVITVPPFEMIALLGAWLVGQRGYRRDWVILGVGAAGSIYTYNAGRIIPIICAVYVLGLLIARRDQWQRIVGGSVIALLTFLLVGAPMLWYAATHFDEFQGRAAYLEQERAAHGFWWNVIDAGGLFNYRGNGNDFFIQEPLLEPLAGALFATGVVVALWRWRDRASRFLVVGLILALVPGVLAVPNANRCITAMPFVYLLIALGVNAWLAGAAGWTADRWRQPAMVTLSAVLIAVAAVESYAEFLGPARRNILGYSPAATAAGLAMRGYIDRYELLAVAGWPENTLTYLAYDGHGSPFERQYVWGQRYEEIEPAISPFGGKGLLFLLDIDHLGSEALERLRQRFPVHRMETLMPPRVGDQTLGRLFFVERRPPDQPLKPNAFDGVNGSGPAEFDEPMGIAFDATGHFYVTERVGNRIQKFTADGTFVQMWGREGEGPGEFREPRDVSADDQYVYVADTWNQRIQVFTLAGAFVREIRGDPAFNGPRGIFARDGKVYLADTGRSIVRIFDSGGRLLRIVGERDGDALGHLIEPADVVADGAGRIYVINSGNNRIEIFDANGTARGMIPIPGWKGRGAKEAYLTVAADGTLFLSDPDTASVRRFNTAGDELKPVSYARIDFPSGIALNDRAVLVGTRRWNTVRGALRDRDS